MMTLVLTSVMVGLRGFTSLRSAIKLHLMQANLLTILAYGHNVIQGDDHLNKHFGSVVDTDHLQT